MKLTTLPSFSLFLSLFFILQFLPKSSEAQSIDWVYEVKDQVNTIPQFFWVDENGNGFYNVRKINPKNRGDAGYGGFLLMLDKDGKFKGTTYVRDCKRVANLLPFGKDQFISSGFNCNKKPMVKDTRLINHKGKTIKKGLAFPGNYFANIWTGDRFSFFTKPTQKWSYTFITIGNIDKNLKITYDSIPLAPAAQKDLGIVNSYKDPFLSQNGTWAIPMQYGKISGKSNGISLDHGTILGVKESKIIWQYPDTLSSFTLNNLSGYKNKIGALMKKNGFRTNDLFVLLDEDGKELKHFYFRPKTRSVKDMILTEKGFILLGQNKLLWYDYDGNLTSEFNLGEENLNNAWRMQLLQDGAIIISAKRNGNAIYAKINPAEEFLEEDIALEEEPKFKEEEKEKEEEEEEESSISYSSIEDISETTLSASVFPNPTSAFINFEFDVSSGNKGPYSLQIFDSSGKLLINKQFNENFHSIDLANYPAGNYVYRISTTQDQKLITGQFIKVTR